MISCNGPIAEKLEVKARSGQTCITEGSKRESSVDVLITIYKTMWKKEPFSHD